MFWNPSNLKKNSKLKIQEDNSSQMSLFYVMSVLLKAIIENNIGFEASHTFAVHILKKLK